MIFLLLFYVHLLNTPPSCQGELGKKAGYPLPPERLPIPTEKEQSPSPGGCNKDQTRSLHKRDS